MFRKLFVHGILLILLIQGGRIFSQDSGEPARSCYRLEGDRVLPLPFRKSNAVGNVFCARFEPGEAWKGKQVFLNLPVMGSPNTLKINDFSFPRSEGGSPAREFNITPFLKKSGNRIDIGMEGPEVDSAWISGCGEAFLMVREGIHVRDVEVSTYFSRARPGTLVRVRLWVKSYMPGKSGNLDLDLEVQGPDGNTEFSGSLHLSSPLSFGQETEMLLDGTVADPRPWSPMDPALYRLEIRQAGSDTLCSEVLSTRFGIRDLALSDSLLVSAADTICLALAEEELTDALLAASREEALRLLAGKKFNAISTSSPVPCFLMELFEEEGLIVIRPERVRGSSADRAHVNSPALIYAE
jgi:beta-galactosidase